MNSQGGTKWDGTPRGTRSLQVPVKGRQGVHIKEDVKGKSQGGTESLSRMQSLNAPKSKQSPDSLRPPAREASLIIFQ